MDGKNGRREEGVVGRDGVTVSRRELIALETTTLNTSEDERRHDEPVTVPAI
jgi:hypothetical protein